MKSLTLLLKSIHSNNRDISIESFSDATIYFAINSGLGPYLNYCTHDSNQNSSENHSRLISSDLTAKLITNSQFRDILPGIISNYSQILHSCWWIQLMEI